MKMLILIMSPKNKITAAVHLLNLKKKWVKQKDTRALGFQLNACCAEN